MIKKIIILISVFIPVLLLDQFLKYIIEKNISLYGTITVIKHYFNIVHVDNRGVAFGFLSGYSYVLIIIFTALIIAGVSYAFFRLKIDTSIFAVSSSMIISGAFSNLLNRIFQGYVVDFLDFHIYGYHWPSFNVADSSIVVGTFLYFFSLMKYM